MSDDFFDAADYLLRYPEVAVLGMDAREHFEAFGERMGYGAFTETVGNLNWPPVPLNNYWLPQHARDFIIEEYSENCMHLYWYLYSVMNQYGEIQGAFENSEALRTLCSRAVSMSAKKKKHIDVDPIASVILPVFNNVVDTMLCITSLLEMNVEKSFEIIVADDGSSDCSAKIIGSIGGIVKYVRQPKNCGFLINCNKSAQFASGQYIILLNNDTLVLPNWLDAILAPFNALKTVGMVGSKLLNWDGTLQEAGGVYWRDGSAWNFGRNQDPQSSEFNYVKDIDYCSGAAIAFPAEVWRELDGFDAAFSPAYCEDADIAFRLRKAGYRTIYAPEAQVIHHEGRSHGRDILSGIKAHQVTNGAKFFARWKETLELENYPNGENVFRARDRSFGKRHVLIIDHYVPQPDQDAGSRSMFDVISSFIDEGYSVTFWPDNLHRDPHYTPIFQRLGVEIIYGSHFVGKFDDFAKERSDLYDFVLLSRPHIAQNYLTSCRWFSNARIAYYGHDVHFRRMQTQASLVGADVHSKEIREMMTLEKSVCSQVDVVIYPSMDEAAFMEGFLTPNNVPVLTIPLYRYSEEELAVTRMLIANQSTTIGKLKLLFVGGFSHHPNEDGLIWFCRDVVPLLRKADIDFELSVVGSNATETVRALAQNDIKIIGFVANERLVALYEESDIAVVPLRYGAGVKGKIIEAMARGLPIVTTDIGAQGIDVAGKFLFLANNPMDFVTQIQRAQKPQSSARRRHLALDFLVDNYSHGAMARVYRSIIEDNS